MFLKREDVLMPVLPVAFFFCGAWSATAVVIVSNGPVGDGQRVKMSDWWTAVYLSGR